MSKSLSELKALLEANAVKLAQLQSLHNMADRADADAGSFADIQSRADRALMQHGKRAGQPMLGEGTMSYRRRLAGQRERTRLRSGRIGREAHTDCLERQDAHVEWDRRSHYAEARIGARCGTHSQTRPRDDRSC